MTEGKYACCPDCGCTDIQVTGWFYVNFPNKDPNADAPLDDVWCPRCEADVRRMEYCDRLDPNETGLFPKSALEIFQIFDRLEPVTPNSENNMPILPHLEQVHVLLYEDKHDSDVTVYGDAQALKRAQLTMMEDPERAFSGKVELDQPTYDAIWHLIHANEFEQGWDLFVKECADYSVYLRVETRDVHHSPAEGTKTGRFSSEHPNEGGAPQAAIQLREISNGKKRYTKTICIDFDGVLHMYTSPWAGAGTILDPSVEGAMQFLVDLIEDERFQPVIYSSRSKKEAGIYGMKGWLIVHMAEHLEEEHGSEGHALAVDYVENRLEFPTQKPAAVVSIDDRGYRFEGHFPALDWLDRFRPWNKRTSEVNAPDLGEEESVSAIDMDTAEEMLDTLSDCLVRYEGKDPGYLYGGGNYYFEPSARAYVAGILRSNRELHQNIETLTDEEE